MAEEVGVPRAWREGAVVVVHCPRCGSTGVNHAAEVSRVSTPENDRALAAHGEFLQSVYRSHEARHQALAGLAKTQDVSVDLKRLKEELDRRLAERRPPSDTSFFRVERCPWCGEPHGARVEDREGGG